MCPNGHTFQIADAERFRDHKGQISCPACKGDTLNRGPIYGAAYGVVAPALVVSAWRSGGVLSVTLAVIAGDVALAAAWTIVFTCGMLLLIKGVKSVFREH